MGIQPRSFIVTTGIGGGGGLPGGMDGQIPDRLDRRHPLLLHSASVRQQNVIICKDGRPSGDSRLSELNQAVFFSFTRSPSATRKT